MKVAWITFEDIQRADFLMYQVIYLQATHSVAFGYLPKYSRRHSTPMLSFLEVYCCKYPLLNSKDSSQDPHHAIAYYN